MNTVCWLIHTDYMPSHQQFIVNISSVLHKKMGLKELARQLGFIILFETHGVGWKRHQGVGGRSKLVCNWEKEEQRGGRKMTEAKCIGKVTFYWKITAFHQNSETMNFEFISNSRQYLGAAFLLQFILLQINFQRLLETADTLISEINKEVQNNKSFEDTNYI